MTAEHQSKMYIVYMGYARVESNKVTVAKLLNRACAGGSWCVCLCLSKHHGRSVQQKKTKKCGAALATESRFPAASYSTGCALVRDRDCSLPPLEKQWWQ